MSASIPSTKRTIDLPEQFPQHRQRLTGGLLQVRIRSVVLRQRRLDVGRVGGLRKHRPHVGGETVERRRPTVPMEDEHLTSRDAMVRRGSGDLHGFNDVVSD